MKMQKIKNNNNKKIKKKSPSKNKKIKDSSSKLKGSIDFASGVWPTERDIIERPDRYKYVRKLIPSSGCVFCESLLKGIGFNSLLLFKNEWSMVILNKFPYNNGHCLVLPTKHKGELLDLTDDEYQEVSNMIKKTVKVVQNTLGCEGLNIGMNHGAVAGAGIPDHLHWHVIPRWRGDTNFFPLIAETKVLSETLEQTYEKLKSGFMEMK